MRDHCAYGLVVCPSSATVSSSTEAANRAVRCQALLSVWVWEGAGVPCVPWPARGLSVRCACGPLNTSDAADDLLRLSLGGRRIQHKTT